MLTLLHNGPLPPWPKEWGDLRCTDAEGMDYRLAQLLACQHPGLMTGVDTAAAALSRAIGLLENLFDTAMHRAGRGACGTLTTVLDAAAPVIHDAVTRHANLPGFAVPSFAVPIAESSI